MNKIKKLLYPKDKPVIILSFLLLHMHGYSQEKDNTMKHALIISSSAFQEGRSIPSIYTCDGKNISPPLSWSQVPSNTQSIAIIVDDPDAPKGTWVHWLVFNLPPHITELPEHASIKKLGGQEGTTSFGTIGYGGPCPPQGTHRYYFKVYALDTVLGVDSSAHKEDIIDAMQDHIITAGQLMGTYSK